MKTYKTNLPLIRLVKEDTGFKKVKIQTSKDAEQYCRNFYHDDIEIYESFFMLLINRANNTIGYVKISQGGTIGTVVDIKIMLKYAIESLAEGVILCHNHPSGNIQPSSHDCKLTKQAKEALNLCGIQLLDHIILGGDEYLSFADEGIL